LSAKTAAVSSTGSLADGTKALVGIDVGGTHTDIVVVNPDGTLRWAHKVLSTPKAPLEAIRQALASVPAGTALDLCVNGTTIGINSLLQRKLPPVLLVATRGFGDLLYIRRETKSNIYDLDWRKPDPLVPRDRTFEVDERIDSEGSVVRPIGDLEPLLRWIEGLDIDDVAVCLLHSYRNPVHEHAVRDAILARHPQARVTLSSDVWPEWREFERTYNTALNAALKPVVEDYLDGLVAAVREAAGHERVYLMHADGGVLRPAEIAERPVLTLLSGTVAGALMGAHVATKAGFDTAVSLDMGGTSTDISLSEKGRPRRSSELSIEWEGTLGFAGVDVVSIGSGGGSIAWADEAGGLHVGPVSAGADPGPAACGLGGTNPTLTDAYVLLGYLGPEPVIGGRRLDADLARSAFEPLEAKTGLVAERLYAGVYEIANASLAAGIRRTTIERGVDPRTAVLLCFGGAGPLHAAAVVRDLGLAAALVPPRPGNGSAFGLLLAPTKHSVSRTHYERLDKLPTAAFSELVDELRQRALAALPGRGADARVEWQLALRYRGQTRDLTVAISDASVSAFGPDVRASVAASFHRKHQEEFTFLAETETVQLVNIRCEAALRDRVYASTFGAVNGHRSESNRGPIETETHFGAVGSEPEAVAATVVERDALGAGEVVDGPAIVLDIGSTILLPPGASGRLDAQANFFISWGNG
jgi:N-methylhydantoinase A